MPHESYAHPALDRRRHPRPRRPRPRRPRGHRWPRPRHHPRPRPAGRPGGPRRAGRGEGPPGRRRPHRPAARPAPGRRPGGDGQLAGAPAGQAPPRRSRGRAGVRPDGLLQRLEAGQRGLRARTAPPPHRRRPPGPQRPRPPRLYTATALRTEDVTGLARFFYGRIGNPLLAQRPERGALPQLYAATAPEAGGGDFIGPDGPGGLRGFPTRVKPSAAAADPEAGRRLWDLSEELTGVRYGLTAS